jgi:uncharacterized protein (DUF1499 family)
MVRKVVGILIGTLVLLLVLATGYLYYQGIQSRTGEAAGLIDGKLTQCPSTPNCVCSEFAVDRDHFVPPLAFSPPDGGDIRETIVRVVETSGGSVTNTEDGYISATFRSRIFGFIDDVEFRIDDAGGLIHIRSASRVGKSDLGANAARHQRLRERFDAQLNKS